MPTDFYTVAGRRVPVWQVTEAVVHEKGKVQLPRRVRQLLNIRPGDTIGFVASAEGLMTHCANIR